MDSLLSFSNWLPSGIPTDGKYSWLFGVFLAAMASIISNLGLTLQKLTHQRIQSGYDRSSRPYYQHVLWILGITLVTFASIADVIALCFAPQSLIAPLGSLTMVSNVIFAPLLLHEKIGVRDLIATMIILSGSIIAVVFGAHEDQLYSITQLYGLFRAIPFLIYASIVLSCIGVFLVMLHGFTVKEDEQSVLDRNRGGPRKSGNQTPINALTEHEKQLQRFAYPAIAGTIGAQSVLFAKCLVELIMNTSTRPEQGNAFKDVQVYLIIAALFLTIFLQIKWLNEGLKRYDTSYIVPVFVSFWIVLSVLSGMIFFHEYQFMSNTQIGLFLLGVLCTISGVILLSFRPLIGENSMSRGTKVFDGMFGDRGGRSGGGGRNQDGGDEEYDDEEKAEHHPKKKLAPSSSSALSDDDELGVDIDENDEYARGGSPRLSRNASLHASPRVGVGRHHHNLAAAASHHQHSASLPKPYDSTDEAILERERASARHSSKSTSRRSTGTPSSSVRTVAAAVSASPSDHIDSSVDDPASKARVDEDRSEGEDDGKETSRLVQPRR